MPKEEEKPAEGAEGAEGAEAPKKKSKLIPMVGSAVVLVAGATAALWYLGIGPFAGGRPKHAEATAAIEEGEPEGAGEAEGGKGGKPGEAPGGLVALAPFIANLADDGGRRYLKATFQIDFGSATVPASVEAHLPQMRDLLLTLFTSKTYDEIRTPEGKQQLREEIIGRVNQVLDRDLAKAVYFTEFIVQ
jgi:flagellar FliL protein